MPLGLPNTQANIFDAFLTRLRTKVRQLNESNCFYCDEAIPDTFPAAGEFFVTVSPDGGAFPDNFQAGGGPLQLVEDTNILITTIIKSVGDQPVHTLQALFDSDKGVLSVWKPRILRAVLCDQDSRGEFRQWMPCQDGKAMLMDFPSIVRCTMPGRVREKTQYIGQTIYVKTLFAWKL